MPFPLSFIPVQSYKVGGRRFGANRPNGRKHAGSDLIAPVGTPIYAVEDGVVINPPAYFYNHTWAFAIRHGSYVARYCEVRPPSPAEMQRLSLGARVQAGEVIAHVGQMTNLSMLHFEVYAGTLHGPLTVLANTPYRRRADLVNSADLLDRLRPFVQASHAPIALTQSLGV